MNTHPKSRESRAESDGPALPVSAAATAEGFRATRSDAPRPEPACSELAERVERATLRRRHRASSFTLIELLVVLSIMALMVGIGLSSMHFIARDLALKTATRQFADDINMARNYAVVNGKFVYLVVCTADTVGAGVTNSPFPWQAYGFCSPYTNNATPSLLLSPTNVFYIEDIRFLPQGVIFDPIGTNAWVSTSGISFPTNTISGTNLWPTTAWVVLFTPTGQVMPTSRWPSFKLCAAMVSSNYPFTPRTITAGSTNVGFIVAINPLIGKPLVYSYP